MQMRKAKFILLALLAIFTFFFSNDFGLIDVEKTSIITAIAVDKDAEGYLVTAQIAVPEATDTNTENKKAEISGKGKTVGEALKNLGDVSGWFPKLAFCNLIILGNGLKEQNVVRVLDYFAKTLRIQDSALVALAEKDGKELLSLSTPLDNISSFALQKIMLKNPGFDRDVCPSDIKSFCSGHYSISGSGYMPLIKVTSPTGEDPSGSGGSTGESAGGQNGPASSSGGASGGQSSEKSEKKEKLFDARTTALFKDGFLVGQLRPDLTVMLNAFSTPLTDTTLPVDDVKSGDKTVNYLLTIISSTPKIDVQFNDDNLQVHFSLSLYAKVSDVDADDSNQALSQNEPLPVALIEKAENTLKEQIKELVDISKTSGCDIFKIKEKLYRHHHGQYSKYKDDYLNKMEVFIDVKVCGQR